MLLCCLTLITHQEGLPAYWGIETFISSRIAGISLSNQEGLPAYWGIETSLTSRMAVRYVCRADQEGLPAYWGIETLWGDIFANW